MKKIITLFALIIFAFNGQAQKWAPLGMTWTYSRSLDTSNKSDTGLTTWVAIDTMWKAGHLCTLINQYKSYVDTNNMTHTMITYEDSGRVYWFSPRAKKFSLLYDFNKKAGESWDVYGIDLSTFGPDTSKCPLHILVKSIGFETINGATLRSLIVETSPGHMVFDGKIIEGIGLLTAPIPCLPYLKPCRPVVDLPGCQYCGLSYINNGTLDYFDFKVAAGCGYKFPNSILENAISATIKIQPNPSNGSFIIKASSPLSLINASVFDLPGRIIYQKQVVFSNNEAAINLDVANGIYILELTNTDGQVFRQRIIKQ